MVHLELSEIAENSRESKPSNLTSNQSNIVLIPSHSSMSIGRVAGMNCISAESDNNSERDSRLITNRNEKANNAMIDLDN